MNSAKKSAGLEEKYDPNCPTCIDFKDWFKKQSNNQVESQSTNKKPTPETTNTSSTISSASKQIPSSQTANKTAENSASSTQSSYYDDCPLFRDQFGKVAWSYLHTMAAHYPQNPTETQMTKMKDFIETFTMFFPCKHCADDFREENAKNPPRVQNNVELSKWFCEQHNHVNVRLGKEEFDCDRVMERWRMGKSKNPKCL